MTRSDIETAYAQYRLFALRGVAVMFIALFACFALVLGWRYWTIGALEDPQPCTDSFAMGLFTAWLLVVIPWLLVRESRGLRRHGLVCPHCDRVWPFRRRKKLLETGACPYCRADLQTSAQA